MHQVSAICYEITSVMPLMAQETLKMVYYAYFHSIIIYGLIFWKNSPQSVKIFKIQRKI
jgi:hypothetical protein